MSLRAYQQTATSAESPRDAEFRLFSQVTLALVEASHMDPKDFA
ncbi:MAG: flagellar biosynthesis regulator FlhF, partial [Phenylobacterium sp.]|nr:flagellar biosynthesis regulator FlhF [Phenylobacterium sp.]